MICKITYRGERYGYEPTDDMYHTFVAGSATGWQSAVRIHFWELEWFTESNGGRYLGPGQRASGFLSDPVNICTAAQDYISRVEEGQSMATLIKESIR